MSTGQRIVVLPELSLILSLLSTECIEEAGMTGNYGMLYLMVNGGLMDMPFKLQSSLSQVSLKLMDEERLALHAMAIVNVHCSAMSRNTVAIGIQLPASLGFTDTLYGRTGLEPKEVKRSGLFTLFRRGGRQLTHQPA